MKKLLLLLVLSATVLLFADFVQIGDTETTSFETPVCGVYDYSWSESLYRQTEIGAPKVIYQLGYYVSNSPSYYTLYNQKLYLKTTQDTMIVLADYPTPDTHGYSLVFEGDITFNGAWNFITLNTPFTYDGLNSLSILWVNEDGDFDTGYPYFFHMNTDFNRMKFKYQDGSFPTTLGTLIDMVPTIRLYYYEATAPDVPSDLYPYNQQVDVPITTGIYWLNGVSTESNIVYFGTDENDLDIIYQGVAVQEISNEILGGFLEEDTDYFYEVEAINSHAQVSTGIKSFHTLSNSTSMLIGTGMSANIGIPWEPQDRYSYTQTLYQASETFLGNVLTSISYYWTGISIFDNEIEIYIGSTDQFYFENTNSWVPLEDLTLVFHGNVHQVPTNSWLTIELDEPFIIDHSRGMVIAIREMTSLFESSVDSFSCTQTSLQRSLAYSSMSDLPDPASPPAGSRLYYVPNTRLYFLDSDEIVYLQDDFENNPDFALDFTPWTSLDLDGRETITYDNHVFPNASDPKGFMTFNSILPVPTVPGTSTHSGARMAVSFPGVDGETDDWLISPLWDVPSFYLGELDGLTLTFWAKQHIQEGNAQAILRVLYSDGSSDPDDFYPIPEHTAPYFLPVDWTLFTVNIPCTDTGQMRIAFNSITAGPSMTFIDDVTAFVSLQNVSVDEEMNTPLNPVIQVSNYPNPFNPVTTISYSIPENADLTLEIFNIKGQKIKTLVNSKVIAGEHTIVWNGTDLNNRTVPSGVYFYKLKAGTYTLTKKMALLK
ncbi:MAG: T9SS type A sorting domain-containing protein [Candidatus Cloacimonetes bacterium]|nr:T9SS type A sorting domain-containing protein [Candidatus Cloacimonadota bacterium]